MANREEVIRGIECCVRTDNGKPNPDCKRCPYFTDWGCKENGEDHLLLDALALLKAQEPRVMTLEELETLQEDDVIWVEIKPVGDLTCISTEIIRFVKKVQGPSTWLELHTTDSAGFYMTRKTTEPNWRCWTFRPDEKRMAETPWN